MQVRIWRYYFKKCY